MITAIDVGGSAVKSGLVGPHGPVGAVHVTPLVHTAPADEIVSRFVAAIRVASGDPTGDGSEPLRVAAAVPDPFAHAEGVSAMTHKFAALHGRPLGPLLADALAAPIDVRWCNDAAAAVAGEATAGAGRAYRRVLGVTLGTGLGAALVADGTLVTEAGGTAIGDLWQTLLPDGRTADTAFCARSLLAALEADPDHGGDRFGRALGATLAPIVAAAGADAVVVGGGGSASFPAIHPALQAELGVPAVRAALGGWAALVGAAHLCFPG